MLIWSSSSSLINPIRLDTCHRICAVDPCVTPHHAFPLPWVTGPGTYQLSDQMVQMEPTSSSSLEVDIWFLCILNMGGGGFSDVLNAPARWIAWAAAREWAWRHWNATAKSLQSCATLCDPIDRNPPGFSRQENRSGLPFPSPVHESEKWKWSCSVVSDS